MSAGRRGPPVGAVAAVRWTAVGTSPTSDAGLDPTTPTAAPVAACASPFAIFTECPHCGGDMRPEHAHYRCGSCGWRDSCCD
jgi:hypothetical protein